MWSDEINKKIEEAEATNNPAYNDKAWENMELLLDKHLPQNKKRRRFILFLLPLALAGGAVFFILLIWFHFSDLKFGGSKFISIKEVATQKVGAEFSVDHWPIFFHVHGFNVDFETSSSHLIV